MIKKRKEFDKNKRQYVRNLSVARLHQTRGKILRLIELLLYFDTGNDKVT